ncbi:MAG: roadblock/LC7 domain-containing protein [Gemmatimonadales bacterium]
MSAPYQELLDNATRVVGVKGVVIVDRRDGLVITEATMEGVRSTAVAALAASMFSQIGKVAEKARVGAPEFVHLEAENGVLLSVPGKNDTVLVAIGGPELNVGLVRLELLKIVEVFG